MEQTIANRVPLQYAISEFLAIYEGTNYQIYILNAKNGDIVQNIQLPTNAIAAITSYSDLFYVYYEAVNYQGGLLSVDPKKGVTKSINMTVSERGAILQLPTFCSNGEIIILYDLYNTVMAYNTTTFDIIWTNTVSDAQQVVFPIICIEPNRILYINNRGYHTWQWHVIDAINGDIIYSFDWEYDLLMVPAVHVDKQILIIDDGEENIVAINITDTDPNHWNNIWKVSGNKFNDVIIVDDSVILTNNFQEIVVLDINNGRQLWQHKFENKDSFSGLLHVTPGIDVNGYPILIAVYERPNCSVNNDTSFMLTALQ